MALWKIIMATLQLILLGNPQIKLNGKPVEGLASAKAQALLFYLAVTGASHSRQALAGLLWSDMSEEYARRNLRVSLSKLRAVLGDYLEIRRRTLAFNQESDHEIDVLQFEAYLNRPQLTREQLTAGTDLYLGDFLADFLVRDAPLFEQWLQSQQERYRKMALAGLYQLATHYAQEQAFVTAVPYYRRVLALEPWLEEAHEQLMVALAMSGQRSAALAQFETCRSLLAEELGVEPSPDTLAIYQRILSGEIGAEAPMLTLLGDAPGSLPRAAPFQAPAQKPNFVGRRPEIAQIAAYLKQPTAMKVAALVGMGGMGKTAVTIALAHQLHPHFEDGVLWANAAISDPLAILGSWAQAFGYDYAGLTDLESRAAALRGVLADKAVLVILDDVVSVSRILPLLPNGPRNAVLLTSRNQDLAYRLDAAVFLLKPLPPENGRSLLTAILGEKRVQAEAAAADEICSLLEYLPLAIEITGQRLNARRRRRLTDMAARLREVQSKLAELTISDQAVRTSFEVSWHSLDMHLRGMFALLGLFNGRSVAAPALAYIADLDLYTTEDRLFALSALSLVEEVENGRYRQHALLADFAREKLGEGGEENGRFIRYYLDFIRQHEQDYEALRPEWGNMMNAMETAVTHQYWQRVIELANALHQPWFRRGRYHQARQGFRWAVTAAEKLQNRQTEADIRLWWAKACIEQSDFDEAESHLGEAMRLYQQLNNLPGVAAVYAEQARLAMDVSHYDEAVQAIAASKAIRSQQNDLLGLAELVEGEARIAYRQGRYKEAVALGHQAYDLYEKVESELGCLQTLGLLTNAILELHKQGADAIDDAMTFSLQALQLAEKLQDQGEIAVAYYGLSRVHLMQQEFEKAEAYAQKSQVLLERLGDRRTSALILHYRCEIQYRQEAYSQALTFAQQSLAVFQALNIRMQVAIALGSMGACYQKLGNNAQAREAWSASLVLAQELGHEALVQRLQNNLLS